MDVNYISIYSPEIISDRVIPANDVNPMDYDDIVKLSAANDVVLSNCTIIGGREDCIDMNRGCCNILVENCILIPTGKYGITIKGGSHNIHLKNVRFDYLFSHKSNYEIDLGNWSDQSSELTRNIVLENVTGPDNSPVHVRVLWSERPTIIGGNVKVTVIPRFLVRIYRFLRARKLVP